MAHGLDNIIGQEETLQRLRAFADLYARTDMPPGHILLIGPEGSGKMTIAQAFVNEFGVPCKFTGSALLEKKGDLSAILAALDEKEVLFISDLPGLRKPIAVLLLSAMRDFKLEMIVGVGERARVHPFRLNRFTCIATAASETACPTELLEAFPLKIALQPYAESDMWALTSRFSRMCGVEMPFPVIERISRLSHRNPHQAELLVKRIAEIGGNKITEECADEVLSILGIDASGIQSNGPAQDLQELSGVEFENLIATLLQRMGFRVEMTKATGDGGVDIVAVMDQAIVGGKYLIQCKRFAADSPVGAPTVREFYGALIADREATKGVVITTSDFSTQARDFAAALPLELIDGSQLRRLLAESSLGRDQVEVGGRATPGGREEANRHGMESRMFEASQSPTAYVDAGVLLTQELVQSLGLGGWENGLPHYTGGELEAIDKELTDRDLADFMQWADGVAAKEGGYSAGMLLHPGKELARGTIAHALEDLASRGSSFGNWDDPDKEVPDNWQQSVSTYLKAWAASLSPSALLGAGELLSRVGRKREAREAFEVALLYPQHIKSGGQGSEEIIEPTVRRARAGLQKL